MADNRDRLAAPAWATTAGLGFLTLNSGLAIYRADGDPGSILFVVGSYTALLLLFRCLRDYESAAGVPRQGAGQARRVAAHRPAHAGLRLEGRRGDALRCRGRRRLGPCRRHHRRRFLCSVRPSMKESLFLLYIAVCLPCTEKCLLF